VEFGVDSERRRTTKLCRMQLFGDLHKLGCRFDASMAGVQLATLSQNVRTTKTSKMFSLHR
jgi:hypothetical protein